MDDALKCVNQSLNIFWLTFIKHIVEKAKESRPTGLYYCTIIADNTSGVITIVFPTPPPSNRGLDAYNLLANLSVENILILILLSDVLVKQSDWLQLYSVHFLVCPLKSFTITEVPSDKLWVRLQFL